MYFNLSDILNRCEADKLPLWEVILENEMQLTETSRDGVFALLGERYHVMFDSAHAALTSPRSKELNLLSGSAKAQFDYAENGGLCGKAVNLAMAYALSGSEINASMGKICAAPTAGSCGILPAVLITIAEQKGLGRDSVLNGLLTAAGIGAVITRNATVAGAEGGCQAECGAAAAMAAAAAVQMSGGTPRQAMNAICFALMNCMGLVCDPIAGLVQIPCAQRNASQTVNALLSADLALAGMQSPITADEAVEAMYKVGKMLPKELRETALGGIAATESAKKLANKLLG